MIQALIAAGGIGLILLASEFLWTRIKLPDEVARKLVHISSGLFIASFGFWVDYNWILILAVGFVIANIINRYTNYVHAIHAVSRKSWGDVLFGVGVFAVAWFEPSAWLFAAAILQVSVADGLAAVVGVTYGQKRGKYYLFGQPKSISGSITFIISSFVIISLLFLLDPYFANPLQLWPYVVVLPMLLACLENLAVYGTDNVVLPVTTLFFLSLL